MKHLETYRCRRCDETFDAYPSKRRKYCSPACGYASVERTPVLEILRRYFTEGSGCWEWTGYIEPDGYGRKLAHRRVYQELVGPVPEGMELDHLCRNRACVNPAHLEPVTHAENMARSAPARKTHCVNGHPYDEANTYLRPSGQRDCRACIRARSRDYAERKAA